MKLKRRNIKSTNFLDLKPTRLCSYVPEDEGKVSVQIPRFESKWMGWLQRRLRRPYVMLRLDEVGSAVWLSCDGEKTVHEIGCDLESKFGKKVAPIWERLPRFIGTLHSGRLIELKS